MLRQLVEVMIILFKEGVFHRDVKDENIMVSYDNFQLKLIDFGCGTNLKKSDYTEFAGTPEFYPPEWFREKRYSAETQTVWSLGVLLWAMLHGEVPFANEGDIKVYKGSVYELKRRVQLTEDTMHFLQKLLNFDERKRPTLRQLINSRWLRKNSEGDEKLSITPAYEGSSLRKSSNKQENSNKHNSKHQHQHQHQTTSHQDLSSYATSHNPQHSQHQNFASTECGTQIIGFCVCERWEIKIYLFSFSRCLHATFSSTRIAIHGLNYFFEFTRNLGLGHSLTRKKKNKCGLDSITTRIARPNNTKTIPTTDPIPHYSKQVRQPL